MTCRSINSQSLDKDSRYAFYISESAICGVCQQESEGPDVYDADLLSMGHLMLDVAVKVSHSVGITGVCTKRIKENFVFVLLSFVNVYCSLWYPIFYINVEFTMDTFPLFLWLYLKVSAMTLFSCCKFTTVSTSHEKYSMNCLLYSTNSLFYGAGAVLFMEWW